MCTTFLWFVFLVVVTIIMRENTCDRQMWCSFCLHIIFLVFVPSSLCSGSFRAHRVSIGNSRQTNNLKCMPYDLSGNQPIDTTNATHFISNCSKIPSVFFSSSSIHKHNSLHFFDKQFANEHSNIECPDEMLYCYRQQKVCQTMLRSSFVDCS